MRRLRDRLGRRRRCRGGGSRCGRPGRGRARGGRLLVGARLRRRRADRPASPLPRRRRLGNGRPECRADRGRLSRRWHGRQLLDLVSHSRRGAGGVGRARLPFSGARIEPRRGLGPARRQHRPQPALAPRRGDATRPRVARLARRGDAARRRRLRTGRRLRLLRLRLSARREAVDAADLARGCSGRGRPHRGRDEGATRTRPEGPHRRRRRRDGACAHMHRRRRGGRDRDPRVAAPLRLEESEHRPRASIAPGDGGLRDLRRGDPPVGRDAAGALLRPAPSPRRRLRDQVRDRPGPSRVADRGGAVGRCCGARTADGQPAAAVRDRSDPARPRLGARPHRS